MTETVRTKDVLEVSGIEVATFTADVTFTWQPGLHGTHHDEPPYAAHGELVDVKQVDGPVLPDAGLTEWATTWLSEQPTREAALARDGGWATVAVQKREDAKEMRALLKAKNAAGAAARVAHFSWARVAA